MKKCPFCAEEIKEEALICRYCNQSLIVINESNKGSYIGEIVFAVVAIIFLIIPNMQIWPSDFLEGFVLASYFPSNQMLPIGLAGIVLSVIMGIGLFTTIGVPGWVWIIYGIIICINPLRAVINIPSFLTNNIIALFFLIASIYFFGGLIKLAVSQQKRKKTIGV